ncbi:Dynamin, GTPase domain protein [Metarhizium rileyi]|uniref:Dynamin, GTPase domain protein n=1 Tax=Metarhizium rileyi (strain RCEF 4871) TaxID=1649241 RepID=A0A167FN14_METRR|nr:Dynamin, GTPase domain protein [Metarhizium rileyi RCEF 4871]
MAKPREKPGAKSLTSPDRLHKIDQLREKNVGTHMPLPQLVVVGDQSSGKSSLLESLTGIPFPNGQGLCTRYATQITHRRDTEQQDISISIIPSPDATDEEKARLSGYHHSVNDTDELLVQFESILADVNAAMGIKTKLNPDGNKTFSQDVLKIEKCGPTEDYLTVIDVPGIFRNTEEGVTTERDKSLVLGMVEGYIEQERTIILAVLPCTVDIMTQGILSLAEKYDKSGERTLGVLTKPDLLKERSTKTVVCDLVNGKKRPLNLGYYIVRNRGADETSEDEPSSRRREDLFKEEPWCNLPPERVGIIALRERLQELLGQITDRVFPKLRTEARKLLADAKSSLKTLGISRQTEREQQRYLCEAAGKFQRIVRDALEANYSAQNTLENKEFRLITQIVNTAEEFNTNFTKLAHSSCFQTDNGTQPFPTTEDCVFSDQTLDPGKFPELDDIIDIDWDAEAPRGEIISWIKHTYHESRGVELGTFGPGLLSSAFREQSKNWGPLTKVLLSKVILIIHHFILGVLEKISLDTKVLGEIKSLITSELLDRYQAGIDQAMLLVSLERDKKPYTLNSAFNSELHGSRSQRVINPLKREATASPYKNDATKRVALESVESIVNKNSTLQSSHEDIHDILKSYYKVARERFVDNIYRQAIDHCLLTGPMSPLFLFNETWVLSLDEEKLQSIAGESRSVREKREQLTKKIQDLEEALKILR